MRRRLALIGLVLLVEVTMTAPHDVGGQPRPLPDRLQYRVTHQGVADSLANLGGIAVAPDGTVYVADSGNHRIQRFTAAGRFLGAWGEEGAGPGQLDLPTGLAVAADGTVWVADSGNRRVQHFGAAGTFLGQWPVAGLPHDVAVAPDGSLWVADSSARRVRHFQADGTAILSWALGTACHSSGIDGPVEIDVAPDGSVYVLAWCAAQQPLPLSAGWLVVGCVGSTGERLRQHLGVLWSGRVRRRNRLSG